MEGILAKNRTCGPYQHTCWRQACLCMKLPLFFQRLVDKTHDLSPPLRWGSEEEERAANAAAMRRLEEEHANEALVTGPAV